MIEEFSHGYWMVDARVLPFGGGEVTVSNELGARLLDYSTRPLLKIGNQHHRVAAESAVPSDVVAVPESELPDELHPALLAKHETAQRLEEMGAA